jgi:uncharacterized protein YceK
MSKRLVLSLLPAVAVSLAALAIFLTGCGTSRNVLFPGKEGPRVFGGVRYDAETAVECVAGPPAAKKPETDPAGAKPAETITAAPKTPAPRPFQLADFLTSVADAPFSVAADTVTLPWVLYDRAREVADRRKQASQPPATTEKP